MLAIVFSLLGLARLVATDPKRRRVFRLAPFEGERHAAAARIVLFGPGVAFAGNGDWAGFTIWFGALSCAGWALVSVPPRFWPRIRVPLDERPAGQSRSKGPFHLQRDAA